MHVVDGRSGLLSFTHTHTTSTHAYAHSYLKYSSLSLRKLALTFRNKVAAGSRYDVNVCHPMALGHSTCTEPASFRQSLLSYYTGRTNLLKSCSG